MLEKLVRLKPKHRHVKTVRSTDRYPRHSLDRLILRALLSLPFIVIALVLKYTDYSGYSTNRIDVTAANKIDFNDTTLLWLVELHPLIPLISASLFRSTLLLGIFGSLVAGWFLQNILEAMRQKSIPVWLQGLFLLAIAGNPIIFFNATENFGLFLGMAAFGVGLIQMSKFIEQGSTYNGFSAGFLFAIAALSDTNGILYLLMALVAIPLLQSSRRGLKGSGRSTVLVILFPAVGVTVSVLLINWVIGRISPLETFNSILYDERIKVAEKLNQEWDVVSVAAFVAPIFIVWFIARLTKKPGAIIASIFIVIVQFTVVFFGIAGSIVTGVTYLILTTLALSLLSPRRTLRLNLLAGVAAALQFLLAWFLVFTSEDALKPFFFTVVTVFAPA